MSQTRVSAIVGFGTLVVITLAFALWGLNPFQSRPSWVPTCSDLTVAMQADAGGAWSVSKPDPDRKINETSTLCEVAFTSGDQRYSGTVGVRVGGDADEDAAQRTAEIGDCPGLPYPTPKPPGYSVLRACNAVIGERLSSALEAAKGKRTVSLSLHTSIPADVAASDAAVFAQETMAKLADLGLTVPESG